MEQEEKQPSTERHQIPESRAEAIARFRHRFRWLQDFSDYELDQISYCSAGNVLKPGHEYFSISHPELGVITVTEATPVSEDECFVNRNALPAGVWNKLVSSYRH